MARAKTTKPPKTKTTLAVGDVVTYHYWDDGALRAASATIVEIHTADEMPQALSLDVDFPEHILAGGAAREQTHARQRTRDEEDVHTSGTWSP